MFDISLLSDLAYSVELVDHEDDSLYIMLYILDVEPPTIECLTLQIFYADKGLLTASSVVWEEPTAYDTVDNNPVIVQTGGPQQNTTLSNETTYVSYIATDEAGNESPECSIELRADRKHYKNKLNVHL